MRSNNNLSQISSITFLGSDYFLYSFRRRQLFFPSRHEHLLARLYIFIGAHVNINIVARVYTYYIDVRASIYTHARLYIHARANIIIIQARHDIISGARLYIIILTCAPTY